MTRRLTVIAGGGGLVAEVIAAARAAGDVVQVLPLVDRSDLGVAEVYGVADLPRLLNDIIRFGATHVTMVGGLQASAAERAGLARFAGGDAGVSGDAALLKLAERALAPTGARIVGAEVIAPGILAEAGRIAGPDMLDTWRPVAALAMKTARAIGALDIGQAAIVTAGRVIAVEDVAGTDALLARVATYRANGLSFDAPMILAKAVKPGQSLVVDRPAIGPETVAGAAKAGIAAIVVEAGGAVVIGRAALAAAAEAAGIAVAGILPDER